MDEMPEIAERNALVAPTVIMADLILPGQTNYYRTMFGGEVMAIMDKAAAIAALRFCRLPIVTASTEHIDFREPIHEGEIIEAIARVIFAGKSSLITRVHIFGENPAEYHRRLCTTGYLSMVAIGPDRKLLSMPELLIEDDQAREEWLIGQAIHQNNVDRRKKPLASSALP
jgi:acyl-CoA hydrolase